MNRAEAAAGLRRRGYGSTVAAQAVKDAEASGDGISRLARHMVMIDMNREWQITPVPWPDGGPRPADQEPAHALLQSATAVKDVLQTIELVDAHLDSAFPLKHPGDPRESGTAIVLGKLGDTAVAALLGIQHVTKDTDVTWLVLLEALDKARSRVPPEERL